MSSIKEFPQRRFVAGPKEIVLVGELPSLRPEDDSRRRRLRDKRLLFQETHHPLRLGTDSWGRPTEESLRPRRRRRGQPVAA